LSYVHRMIKESHLMKQSKDVLADNRDKYALRDSEKP